MTARSGWSRPRTSAGASPIRSAAATISGTSGAGRRNSAGTSASSDGTAEPLPTSNSIPVETTYRRPIASSAGQDRARSVSTTTGSATATRARPIANGHACSRSRPASGWARRPRRSCTSDSWMSWGAASSRLCCIRGLIGRRRPGREPTRTAAGSRGSGPCPLNGSIYRSSSCQRPAPPPRPTAANRIATPEAPPGLGQARTSANAVARAGPITCTSPNAIAR